MSRLAGRSLTIGVSGTLAMAGLAGAATSTWTDGGGDGLWATAANWDTAPVTGDDLVIGANSGEFQENDLDTAVGGAIQINSLTFAAGIEEFYLLEGNAIDFDGKTLTNNDTTHDIDAAPLIDVQLQESGGGITVAGDGHLILADINTSSFGKPFNKIGAGRVVVQNTNDSWTLTQEGGEVAWESNILFGTQTINGGTLEGVAGDIMHGSAVLQLNSLSEPSIFKMGANVATTLAVLEGAADSVVSSLGLSGETSTLQLGGAGDSREFAGSIQDGEDGATSALHLTGGTTHTLVLSGQNTYTGNTTVDGGATLELATGGSLTLQPRGAGDSNTILGGGDVILDGELQIDLSEIGSPAIGDKWSFIQASATYGANFAVAAPFTESSPGVWTAEVGGQDFYFSELSGTASYGVAPELIWDGGGSDDLWSNADNWNSTPTNESYMVFDGTTQLTNTNDLDSNYVPAVDVNPEDPATLVPSGILFQPTAGAFVLEGNAIDFAGKTITSRSPETQTFNLDIQADSNIGGFTVDTSVGEVVLTGTTLRNGFNDPLVKLGAGRLSIIGPKMGADTFAGEVQEGYFYADPGANLFFHTTIAAGATLEIGSTAPGGVIHNGGNVVVNGTLILGEGTIEDIGDLGGSGVVTNNGAEGTTSIVQLRTGRNTTLSGSLNDGANGGVTGLDIGLPARAANGTFTLSGENGYTGDTTINQPDTSLVLTDSGTMRFKLGADEVNTRITAAAPQALGTTTLNGTFVIDTSEAETLDGNSWSLVDVDVLNVTFGDSLQLVADDGSGETPFTETAVGSGVWNYDDGTSIYSFSEATGVLSYGRTPTTTWAGGGTDGNWSSEDNWDRELLSGDMLSFAGSGQTASVNDLDTAYDFGTMTPGSFEVGGITFDDGAGAFSLSGNAVDLTGKTIRNNSTETQTFDLEVQVDGGVGGLTVDTSAGDVVLNSLTLGNGANAGLVKDGMETLYLNGPLGGSDAFAAFLNEGTLVASQPAPTTDSLFQDVTIAAGTMLRTEGDAEFGAIHNQGMVTVNGMLDLAEGVIEDIGNLQGSGVVTSHGGSGTTSTLRVRTSEALSFSGRILDSSAGGATALDIGIPGEADAGTLTLGGLNTYSGATTLQQSEASLVLAESGMLSLWAGANGVSNGIAAATPLVGGSLSIEGILQLDLSGANLADGNAWTLVDVANTNASFGDGFQLLNSGYRPATSYAVSSGGGAGGAFEDATAYITGGSNETFGNAITIPGELANPAPESVYTTSRIGQHSYNFADLGPGAEYTVRFHSAELWGGTGAGGRVSDIYINGQLAYDNHDPFTLAGGAGNVAAIVEITATASPAGTMVIEVRPDAASPDKNCRMNAIEILPVSAPNTLAFTESADVWTMIDGSRTWSFSEATGVLSLAAGAGGDDYNSWAAANGIAGQPMDGDFDGDGLANGIEYGVAGLDPTVPDAAAGSFDGSTLSFQKRAEAVANGDVSYTIETSTDLGDSDPWTTAAADVNDSAIISYTLPGGEVRDFARLKVE